MRAPAGRDVAAGEVLLAVDRVSLSFGGVRALVEVSFDIRKGVVRARVAIRDMKVYPAPARDLEQAA